MAYNTADELKNEIVNELTFELTALNEMDIPQNVIVLKVNDAYREAQEELKIPGSYNDNQIMRIMNKVYMNIKAKAFCKLNRIGFEYQDSNNENGVSRHFVEYEKLSNGIIPIARVH